MLQDAPLERLDAPPARPVHDAVPPRALVRRRKRRPRHAHVVAPLVRVQRHVAVAHEHLPQQVQAVLDVCAVHLGPVGARVVRRVEGLARAVDAVQRVVDVERHEVAVAGGGVVEGHRGEVGGEKLGGGDADVVVCFLSSAEVRAGKAAG